MKLNTLLRLLKLLANGRLEMEDSLNLAAFQNRRRDYFGKFRFLCKLLGLSLEKNESVAYQVYSRVFILVTLFSYCVIRVLDLRNIDETLYFYDTIVMPYGVTLAFFKSVIFLWNRAKLAKLLDKLEQEPFLPNPNRGNEVEEEKLHKNCMKIIKIQSTVYIGTIVVVAISVATETLIKRIINEDFHYWDFPYRKITLLNVTHSPNYELWWFFENFSAPMLGMHFLLIDSVMAAVLTYISFQFKILQSNIRRIMDMSYNEMLKETGNFQDPDETSVVDASMIPWKYLKKSLIQDIDYHLAILSVADEVEAVFNGMLLFLFLNTLGLLGALGGHATLVTRICTFGCCGQLFASCVWGEQLTHESQEVGRAAFEVNFVGADLRFQKSLALIIRRTQNPFAITAGKFAVVGLPTLTWVGQEGTFVVCGQLTVSCFWTEQLMHESQEVERAAFDSNFVGADLKFQKSHALIIRRSQNPFALTAGKFTRVGLSPFIWILRAGYSASTVLRKMK